MIRRFKPEFCGNGEFIVRVRRVPRFRNDYYYAITQLISIIELGSTVRPECWVGSVATVNELSMIDPDEAAIYELVQ